MEIKHDEQKNQFLLKLSENGGVLKYQKIEPGILEYTSTFVDPDIRGRGYGKKLVKYALDYAEENNLKIIPACRMVKRYIQRHNEYQKLVPN